jgi:glycosyltransferase involved in cell wall biosynthesis
MRASVIIPSFQSATTIGACLTALLAQEFDDAFDVIVADSGPGDTAAIVRRDFPSVRLLRSDARLDPAVARNLGAAEAPGTVLAFIDADCIAPPDWLQALCDAMADRYDGVGGAIRNPDGASAADWAGYFCEFREFLPRGQATDATNLTLGNAAYRADTFRRAGGFPGGYFPQEDQVFHQRLLAEGARIRFDPSIVVTHVHGRTVPGFLAHQSRIGTANARVARALGLRGSALASHRWAAALLLPALATYRFARTAAACWTFDRFLMLRSPTVTGLCWLGMFAWGVGFIRRDATATPALQHRSI